MKLDFQLFVDSREPDSIFKILDDLSISYKKEMLPVGDFVYNDIVFERKEMNDMYKSIISGRIFDQVVQMKANFEKVYVLISRSYVSLHEDSNPLIVVGSIASLCEKYNIKVLRVEDDKQLIIQMLKICEKSTEPKVIHTKRLGINNDDVYLSMLTCIPGVSIIRAGDILKRFSFLDIFKASEKELLEVKGIGFKTAKEIKKFLR